MPEKPDDRSLLAHATDWASRSVAAALQMVVPILIGVWLDRRLGTSVVFLFLGIAIGLFAGMWSLLRMTQPTRRRYNPRDGRPKDDEHRL